MFFFGPKIKSTTFHVLSEDQYNKLIDVREPYEFNAGHIKNTKNVPMLQLLNNPDKFMNKEEEYYIMCHRGVRSARVVTSLNKLGYNVVNIKGGYVMYKRLK